MELFHIEFNYCLYSADEDCTKVFLSVFLPVTSVTNAENHFQVSKLMDTL